MFDREQLNFLQKYWLLIDKKLFYLYFLLLGFGLLFIFTASMPVANRIGASTNYFFIKKHLFFMCLSIFLFLFITIFSDNFTINVICLCFCVLLLMLVAVLFGGFSVKGARRWLYILGFSIQPSEIIKPFLIIINSYILAKLKDKNDITKIILSFIPYGLTCFLILLQPDIGMLMLLISIYILQIFLSDIKFRTLLICGISTILLMISCYIGLPHVRNRVNSYLVSLKDKDQMNYQVMTSINGYNNSGLLGQGFLEGKAKNVIPDSHTDFIFPVITEEFGFFISTALILIYVYITLRVMIKAIKEEDTFKSLVLFGLSLLIIVQTFINIGVTLNLLPTKGMTLPFFSYGGSSLLGTSITFAFIIKYSRHHIVYDNHIQ